MNSIGTINVFGTLIPNELQDENIVGDLLQAQYTFCSFATTQQVLLRASSAKKCEFLSKIFEQVKNHKYARMICSLLMKHFQGKLTKYLSTLDRSEYISDVYGKDNNRTMDSTELDNHLETTLAWFKFLTSTDLQMGIFLSFLSMCENYVITRVLKHIQERYNEKISFSRTTPPNNSTMFLSYAEPSSVLLEGYVEDWDENDPDVQLIFKKRKEWNDAMAKYRSKVKLSINGPDEAESKKKAGKAGRKSSAAKSPVKKSDKKSKTGTKTKKANKGKKEKETTKPTKEDKSKKGRKSKAGSAKTKLKPEIDFIQLLPIWISLKIFKYLDEKTLKLVKGVNIYWEFVVTCLSQEQKGRKKIDAYIESLEDEFKLKDMIPVYPTSIKPQLRFRRADNVILACDPKVRASIEAVKRSSRLPQVNTSLISEIANNPEISFYLPVNNLQPFQRLVSDDHSFTRSKYIHQRPSCIHFDNVTVDAKPIENIDFTSELIDELLPVRTSSFDFWPEVIREYEDPESNVVGRRTSAYLARWNPLNKNIEMERMLLTMVERSIARFRRTISRRTLAMSEQASSMQLNPETTKKSIQLEMIHTSLQLEVFSTEHLLGPSEIQPSEALRDDDQEERELFARLLLSSRLETF